MVLVIVVVDLVSSAAALRAISIIVAISTATNIFFISKPLFSCEYANPRFKAVIPPS